MRVTSNLPAPGSPPTLPPPRFRAWNSSGLQEHRRRVIIPPVFRLPRFDLAAESIARRTLLCRSLGPTGRQGPDTAEDRLEEGGGGGRPSPLAATAAPTTAQIWRDETKQGITHRDFTGLITDHIQLFRLRLAIYVSLGVREQRVKRSKCLNVTCMNRYIRELSCS